MPPAGHLGVFIPHTLPDSFLFQGVASPWKPPLIQMEMASSSLVPTVPTPPPFPGLCHFSGLRCLSLSGDFLACC